MISRKRFKLISIGFSLILLGISLTQNVLFVNGRNANTAINYFLVGAISIIGGGTFEWLIWLANPLCLISIFLFYKDKKKSIKFCLTALFLSISFFFWKEILVSESGATGKILSFELGYYLWLSSIFFLSASICFYFIRYKNIDQSEKINKSNLSNLKQLKEKYKF